jgi:hypothetical protein
MKSKASATTIRKMTEARTGSGMFQDDSFDDVGGILTKVDGFLDPLEYFLPRDQLDGTFSRSKRRAMAVLMTQSPSFSRSWNFSSFGTSSGQGPSFGLGARHSTLSWPVQ